MTESVSFTLLLLNNLLALRETRVPKCPCTCVQVNRCTSTPLYLCIIITMYRYTSACIGVQVYRYTNVKVYHWGQYEANLGYALLMNSWTGPCRPQTNCRRRLSSGPQGPLQSQNTKLAAIRGECRATAVFGKNSIGPHSLFFAAQSFTFKNVHNSRR